jgi:hypothetical protein
MKPYMALAGMAGFVLLPTWEAAQAQDATNGYDPYTETLSVAPVLVQGAQGDVKAKTSLNSSYFSLKNGAKIRQGAIVQTGSNGRVSLVFSNGAVVVLTANSKLTIDRFQQAGGIDLVPVGAPYDRPTTGTVAPVGTMEREPSYSMTDLFLSEGVAYARVKKLDKRSSYFLRTPLGTTKILGTIWRQTHVKKSAQMQMVTTIEQDEGMTEFDPVDTPNQTNKPTKVRSGQILQVTGTFTSMDDFNRVDSIESIQSLDINVTVNLNLNIATRLGRVEDPTFLSALDEYLPQQLEEGVELASKEIIMTEEDPADPDAPFFINPVFGAPGALGAFGGGGGGSFPPPESTPTPRRTPPPFSGPSPTPPPPAS